MDISERIGSLTFERAAKTILFIIMLSAIILMLSVAIATWLNCMFSGDLSGWVQAVGAILAIVSGFAIANYQTFSQRQAVDEERRNLAQAAHTLAFEALETISERLNAALTPKGASVDLALRGDRTTEMVLAMREFDTTRLPTAMLSDFIRLRTHVFAINERITDRYVAETKGSKKDREDAKEKRHAALRSSVTIRGNATQLFASLQKVAADRFGSTTMTINTGEYLAAYDPNAPAVELTDP